MYPSGSTAYQKYETANRSLRQGDEEVNKRIKQKNIHYYQYTRPNRKSASSKHTLSGPQKTDSGLLMHYQPYS